MSDLRRDACPKCGNMPGLSQYEPQPLISYNVLPRRTGQIETLTLWCMRCGFAQTIPCDDAEDEALRGRGAVSVKRFALLLVIAWLLTGSVAIGVGMLLRTVEG